VSGKTAACYAVRVCYLRGFSYIDHTRRVYR
jgi:hypothetical protein